MWDWVKCFYSDEILLQDLNWLFCGSTFSAYFDCSLRDILFLEHEYNYDILPPDSLEGWLSGDGITGGHIDYDNKRVRVVVP